MIRWSNPVPTKPKGRGNYATIPVKTAGGSVPADRFRLFQTRDMQKKLPTMWVLWDEQSDTRHFIYGQGWEGAQQAAEGIINSVSL
jgi:hypothetical protein